MPTMHVPQQIATHLRHLYLGVNSTGVNFQETVSDISRREATTRIYGLNTIAVLLFHVDYYVGGLTEVLRGGDLTIRDKYSFDLPPIETDRDWENLRDRFFQNGETFARLIEQLPAETLSAGFVKEAYGNYYRNLQGFIEHAHYHLGQIVLLKKIMRSGAAD